MFSLFKKIDKYTSESLEHGIPFRCKAGQTHTPFVQVLQVELFDPSAQFKAHATCNAIFRKTNKRDKFIIIEFFYLKSKIME